MRVLPIVLALSVAPFFALPAVAQPLGGEQPLLKELAGQVSADRLHGTIGKLVGFGTRHAASDAKSPTRGIGAARRWIASEFAAASKDCGGRLLVETPSQVMTAERLPGPTEIQDVLGVLPGTTDPNRVIVISGHYDSRVT